MTPLRIQRSRARGAKLPEGTIYVGRPSKWGNPFDWQEIQAEYGGCAADARGMAISLFRDALTGEALDSGIRCTVHAVRRELAGHHLACWCRLCPDHRAGKPLGVRCEACAPCHVDVLGELLCG